MGFILPKSDVDINAYGILMSLSLLCCPVVARSIIISSILKHKFDYKIRL